MTEPKGPKPRGHRHPDVPEPHFEQGVDEQPMYATDDPEVPAPQRGAAGPSGPTYGGSWDVPGTQGPGSQPRSQRQAEQGKPAGDDRTGRGGAGRAGPGQPQADPAERSAAGDARPPVGQVQGDQRSAPPPQHEHPADNPVEQLKAQLSAAEAGAKENHEQYLRALAEMENVRRRAQDDVSKAHKYAIESFAESMLPVRDSLEMALTVEVPSVENLREGVEATLRQLTSAFERNRVVVIDPLRQKFDPNLHQAISMVPSKDVPPNHVASVLQKGYMINDRILRPALVTVSQPA